MPDFSMCLNKDCPIKEKCYRFMARPDHQYQSYTSFNYNEEGCHFFYEIEEGKEI